MIGKIISWNVRGVNGRGKRLIIRECLSKWKPTVVCLQESIMEECDIGVINSLWSLKDKGWPYIPTKGAAGGMILMRIDDQVQCVDVTKGECTISCIFRNCKGEFSWMFTGVYCKENREEKVSLQNELLECRSN